MAMLEFRKTVKKAVDCDFADDSSSREEEREREIERSCE